MAERKLSLISARQRKTIIAASLSE
ncbi:hypothetical protein RSAG8_13718, partial [Rhizoctonia solani AG-8 WAC10335]